MIEGPLGGAAFNNEFGRPQINGYFRTFEQQHQRRWHAARLPQAHHARRRTRQHPRRPRQERRDQSRRQTHRPRRPGDAHRPRRRRRQFDGSGSGNEDLDFASVQRDNAEMERRCQEVIDRCWALGEDKSHLVHPRRRRRRHFQRAARTRQRRRPRRALSTSRIPNDEPGMSARSKSGATKSQERYVLAVAAERLDHVSRTLRARTLPLRRRRRSDRGKQHLTPRPIRTPKPIDMPLEVLLGKPPRCPATFPHHRSTPR